MILRVCILWLMTLALALPGFAAMPGPDSSCPSQRDVTCEIPREIAAIPADTQPRTQAELPCLWKAMLAGADVPPPPYRGMTFISLPQNDMLRQGLVPTGPERPPRAKLA